MNDSHMVSIAQIKEFIKVSKSIEFQGASRKEKYQWIETVLNRFRYFSCRKKDKSILKTYLEQMTGYCNAQLTRLIAKKRKFGKITAETTNHHKFAKIYTAEDIALLIKTDKAHDRLSGPATKKILGREFNVFSNEKYERIKNISVSHLYNLRGTRQYQSHAKFYTKTRPVKTNIGERRKPDSQGKPGYLRVDTVHQGDLEREKGVYHINMVDEATQWEIVGAVEKISEQYLLSLLEDLLEQYPFKIINFHSDNGSEFINKRVAKLLNKLLIKQTKSRARHCNDNALTEGKNGSIIRKHMGYIHIPQKYAKPINEFYQNYFNVYLNYHRPCGFATISINAKGKEKKVYNIYRTPYEALKTHSRASEFLKESISLKKLDQIALKESDNECAEKMQKAKDKLFDNFKHQIPRKMMTFISGSYVD